jgi:antagonist of KipI
VLRPGLFTTIQDLGRRGHRAEGVPLGGAADPFTLRLVNSLVGNPEDAAALEFTLIGPELRFQHETIVALGGADFSAMPRWRPLKLAAGTRLNFGPARSGCRGYLAVAGGAGVEPVLGSGSTYVRGRLGGFEGRALAAGDVVPVPIAPREIRDHWRIDERILPRFSAHPIVRVLRGAQADEFGPEWLQAKFNVSSRSDRMGARLSGEAVSRATARELVSSPAAPGTIQVPPDGQPIVLLADAQTIGGYPQLGHVLSVDLPLVAQLRPGDTLQFQEVSLEAAQALIIARERTLALLREGLAQKLA